MSYCLFIFIKNSFTLNEIIYMLTLSYSNCDSNVDCKYFLEFL